MKGTPELSTTDHQSPLQRLLSLDPDRYPPLLRELITIAQLAALVGRDFVADRCFFWASALSFTMLLSLVPLFAITFAVMKGLGVPNYLEPLILSRVAAGSQMVVERVVAAINNTNMGSVGTVGILILFVSALGLLDSTEQAFNAIWGVKGQRTLLRKVSDYTSIMVVVPILFIAATSITTTFQNQEIVQWMLERTYLDTFLLVAARIFPYVSIWVALLFLYRVIPSVQVRFSSALMGAVIAGALWQWAQWGYIHFQVGVARANAIYGTLSALPVFMAWLYTSWLIVLLGVEVAYAHQNLRTIRRENRHSQLSFANRQLLALAMLQRIAESFSGEREPWSVEELAADLDLPARLVREVSMDLTVAGILTETNHELPHLHPSRELDRIGVADVLQALAGKGGGWEGASNKSVICLRQLLADVERGGRESLAGLTLRSLISSCGEEGSASTESPPAT